MDKCVALHTLGTATIGYVIEYFTDGTGGTSAWTRIHTLVAHTGTIASTIRVQYTLRTTADERISLVISYAAALTIATDGIGATG